MLELNKENILNLQKKYGESFYLLDSYKFKNNFLELKKAFTDIYPNFNIAYSYKTNYTPKLCKIVNSLNGYAEVVSEMEVELARKIGVDYTNIIWNGPIKNKKELKSFLLKGGIVNIDSLEEFEFIRQIIEKNSENIFKLGIRCNFDVEDNVLSRFGFDINGEDFQKVLTFLLSKKNVKLINFQCHFAKRQIEYWPKRVEEMLNLIDKIKFVPERIDLGGGLLGKMEDLLKNQFSYPIPSYVDYAKIIATMFKNKFEKSGKKPELIIEPGTALVGDCMKFISPVKSIKEIRGKKIATILGSQKNISMSGVNPPIEIINICENPQEYKNIDIVGYTCIEGDVIYKNYTGKIGLEDIVIINNCGSYSLVMKPPFILPNFAVIDISGEKVEVIKEKETFDDIFKTFIF